MAKKSRLEARLDALEGEVKSLRAENAALRQANGQLRKRVTELETQLGRTSRNSSQPPSSDPPWTPPRTTPPTGRRPGGQPGHPGRTRLPFAAEDLDAVVGLTPAECRGCAHPLKGGRRTGRVRVHQVVEVPAAPATVTEYRRDEHRCARCGTTTWAPLPTGVTDSALGARLQAVISVLTGRFRLSRREAQEALPALFGPKARVALGTIVAVEQRTSAALAPVHAEALTSVRGAPVVGADETIWREHTHKSWLWNAVTRSLAVFRIDRERSRAAFRRLLGPFAGLLITDRWGSYHSHPAKRRQLCWAHLKRNFQELAERRDGAAVLGRAGLRAADVVLGTWRRHRAGAIGRRRLRDLIRPLRRRFERTVKRHRNHAVPIAAATARDLLRRWDALWTFTRHEGVEPHNNAAERTIRKAVLWRKGSFGTESASGSRFVERMLTATESLRLQGRTVLDFVEAAIRAATAGRPAPSLVVQRP